MLQVIVIIALGLVIGSTAEKDWYETASFYQIYPPSFFDGGDGTKPGTGTLKGIEAKLDYIKDLGVDCIWLTPIFESSFAAFGYDITNYEGIDPRYGTLDAFESLIKKVHEKEMKIIVDFVPNHCGVEHDFFQKSIQKVDPYTNYFVWDAGVDDTENNNKTAPSNWQRIGGGPKSAWNYDDSRKEYFYAQFYKNMPDFNLRSTEVKAYLEKVMKFWMDKGIDGFRIDAISHGYEALPVNGKYQDEPVNSAVTDPTSFDYLNHIYTQDQPELFELIKAWRKMMDDYKTEKTGDTRIIMTESYSSNDVIKKFYEAGSDLPFNFQMINKIKAEAKSKDFVDMVNEWLDMIPSGKITNWVIGNHDQPRVATRFGTERIDIFNTLVTLLPGAQVTYYGEEIGMENTCAYFEEGNHDQGVKCKDGEDPNTDAKYRTPMQWDETKNAGFSDAETTWLPVNDNYVTLNVKAQTGKDKSHLEIYRQLMKLRKHNAFINGEIEIKALTENAFAFSRYLKDTKEQSILVVINFGNKTEKVNLQSLANIPDLMTVEVTGGSSAFTKGDQVWINNEIELKQFESIVAYYNTATGHLISKLALLLLTLVSVVMNLKL